MHEPAALHVKPAGRFIEEQDTGAVDDGTRDTHPLLHSLGECPDRVASFFVQPHLHQDLINPLVPECPAHAIHLSAQVQVLFRGKVAIDRAALRE